MVEGSGTACKTNSKEIETKISNWVLKTGAKVTEKERGC